MLKIETQPLFELSLTVEKPLTFGPTPYGERRWISVVEGSFEGPQLKGKVLPGGGDWLLLRHDGIVQQNVRIALQTEDGELIYMSYRGLRHGPEAVIERLNRGEEVDPSEYYFCMAPSFETGSKKYAWINGVVAVGSGQKTPTGVAYSVYKVS